MSKLVENFPGVLRDAVPRFEVINKHKIEEVMNEGVRVGKANPLSKRTEILSIYMVW